MTDTAPAPQRGYKRSWKNYFLNARYQMRFTLFMVALCAVMMGGLGWWVMKEARNATKVGESTIQGNAYMDESVQQAEIANLRSKELRLEIVLLAIGVALSLGLFVYGIKMTHKVAGPLFKIQLYLDKVKNNRYDKVYNLRKGDQLVAFFDHFREAHEALRKRQEQDVTQLREIVGAAESANLAAKSPALAACLEDMKQLLKSKEGSLA